MKPDYRFPPVSKIEKFRPEPNDRYIIHLDWDASASVELAHSIARRFLDVMRLPEDTPVAVFARGVEIEIVNDARL